MSRCRDDAGSRQGPSLVEASGRRAAHELPGLRGMLFSGSLGCCSETRCGPGKAMRVAEEEMGLPYLLQETSRIRASRFFISRLSSWCELLPGSVTSSLPLLFSLLSEARLSALNIEQHGEID